jgi:hypothetical protein
MALAAKSNGTQSLDDSIQRTKILLLGQQGSVSPLLTHVRSPSSILPRAEVERPPSSSSFSTTYPRNKPSFSNPRLEQLNIHTSAFDILLPFLLLISPRSASTVIPLEIWDCPGNITLDSLGATLSEFSSIIFVIDIQVSVIQLYIVRTLGLTSFSSRILISSRLRACLISSLQLIRRIQLLR